ncbi:hypothetical protein M011DRAFT_489872 [Sporormia fimetaria CBS 119925]|uniref:Uncharacterized protein n=1 Tax=Sporormia fimetaria CBS 119925 TaxID=1340428 RepID=A0A6A6UZZ1_9PLEO|nr:hypothetical protein M011DRAFT_489872 [Sporormia fimetaria CBS 119925]
MTPIPADQPLPLLFTLPPSARHEILLLDPENKLTLKELNKLVTERMKGSPNCEEFMSKYKSRSATSISSLKIHWSSANRDKKAWPEYTVLTNDNLPAVMAMLRLSGGVGRDVLEVGLEEAKRDAGGEEGEKKEE